VVKRCFFATFTLEAKFNCHCLNLKINEEIESRPIPYLK
jgi:hypothetical protein